MSYKSYEQQIVYFEGEYVMDCEWCSASKEDHNNGIGCIECRDESKRYCVGQIVRIEIGRAHV